MGLRPYYNAECITHVPTGESVLMTDRTYSRSMTKRVEAGKRIIAARLAAGKPTAELREVAVYELPDEDECPQEFEAYRVPIGMLRR